MLTIEKTATGRRSLVLCDTCNKPIYNAHLAVALVGYEVIVAHAHKGRCHDRAEEKFEKQCSGWMELNEHLAQLVHNSAVHAEAGPRAVVRARELQDLRERVQQLERSRAYYHIRELHADAVAVGLRDWILQHGGNPKEINNDLTCGKIYETSIESVIEMLREIDAEEKKDRETG